MILYSQSELFHPVHCVQVVSGDVPISITVTLPAGESCGSDGESLRITEIQPVCDISVTYLTYGTGKVIQ